MALSRRRLLSAAGAAALGGLAIPELVERLATQPARAAGAPPHLREQHLVQALRIVVSDGIEVFAPPLHSELVTATLDVAETPPAIAEARAELESQLARLDRLPGTAAGLVVTVGWGLPYFRRFVPGQAARHLPVDVRATSRLGRTVYALLDAVRFPSDPGELVLENNEVAVLLRSDSLDHIRAAEELLFPARAGTFRVTSIRRGFAGGGFGGATSLPKRVAVAAGVPGAHLIPDHAELFLGFTSTQKQITGRERIANFETLGYTDVGAKGYFAHGTHMHVSHLYEDLEAWYGRFSHQERVDSAFRPGVDVAAGTLTVRQGAEDVESESDVESDYRRYGRIGHSGSIQPASRLQHDVAGTDGTLYPAGTPIPHRADFNTLDHPFSWTATPAADRAGKGPRAGLHFVVFNPSSDDFNRGRLAMDGRLPGGRVLRFDPGKRGQGFNDVLTSTHRQNFLVPPRAHRAFPLSEL